MFAGCRCVAATDFRLCRAIALWRLISPQRDLCGSEYLELATSQSRSPAGNALGVGWSDRDSGRCVVCMSRRCMSLARLLH